MKKTENNFYKTPHLFCISRIGNLCGIFALTFGIYSANAASVVQRSGTGTTTRPTTVARTNITNRLTTVSTSQAQPETTLEETDTIESATEPESIEETLVIENKSSQFDTVLNQSGTNASTDSSDSQLSELIQKQRAALDAQDASATATQSLQNAISKGVNACDTALRECMKAECGNDFSKCSGDTDTTWGNKMDLCRQKADCTGEEYRLFTTEIKADRDMNARLALYNEIIDCGNRYNDCIITQCGTTFSKCLGKSAGDAAISACATIANNCKQQDSGLAGRAMQGFATLRQNAEVQVQKDENRLYELRDLMAEQCRLLGAAFDERSLDCVYTVEFYAGEDSTLYASKKAYAGNTFDCTPNWFGIDVTTFMENAYRLTRAQTSASSSLLGSGLGVAAGAFTSGAISRAIDTQKAENALKDAEKEHEENYGDKSSSSTTAQSEENDSNAANGDGKKTEQNNAQGSDDSEATSDTGSPKITVNFVDNNENPIKNTTVTLNGTKYRTNRNGAITLDDSLGNKASIEIKIDGFETNTISQNITQDLSFTMTRCTSTSKKTECKCTSNDKNADTSDNNYEWNDKGKLICKIKKCKSDRYKLNSDKNRCEDQVGEKCTSTDPNAKEAKYKWENNQLICEIKKCKRNYTLYTSENTCKKNEATDNQ